MENNEQMANINRRNTKTVEQVLKEQNAKIVELNQTVNLLGTTVSSLIARLQSLEIMIITQKAASIGHGPTVK